MKTIQQLIDEMREWKTIRLKNLQLFFKVPSKHLSPLRSRTMSKLALYVIYNIVEWSCFLSHATSILSIKSSINFDLFIFYYYQELKPI